MKLTTLTRTSLTGIGLVTTALALPAVAAAQGSMPDMPEVELITEEEARALPLELQSAPTELPLTPVASQLDSQTSIGPDGVETVTRTRRITRSAPYAQAATSYVTRQAYEVEAEPLPHTHTHTHAPVYTNQYSHAYAPGAQVFQREQWIAECERRTDGYGDRRKGGIIGGLLGAIAGGVIGNRLWDSERLAGTLIGVGAGGIGGAILGSLIGGGRNDRGEYDCAAALDAYLSQYAQGGGRVAARSIPAPAPVYAAPAYSYSYAAPQYYYQPPQQITYVPIEYQQRQRVIVRETVREEVIPGARRIISAPPPAPAPRPQPRPIKGEPRYIKGN